MNIKRTILLVLLGSVFCGLPNAAPWRTRPERGAVSTIDAKDETGLTALMQAAWEGETGPVKKLLQSGADPKIADQYGWTALNYAVAIEHADTAKVLTAGGATVNIRDRRQLTPLMWAALSGKSEIVTVLLAGGAEVNAADPKGATAFSFAVAKGHNSIAKALRKAGGVGPQVEKADLPQAIAPVDRQPKPLNGPEISQAFFLEARKTKPSGTISLRLQLGVDGKVKQVKVVKRMSGPLTEAAVRIAFGVRVTPAEIDGKPVEYWYAFRFSMG
jgi:hypothetical protein